MLHNYDHLQHVFQNGSVNDQAKKQASQKHQKVLIQNSFIHYKSQMFQFIYVNYSSVVGEEDAKAEDVDGKHQIYKYLETSTLRQLC